MYVNYSGCIAFYINLIRYCGVYFEFIKYRVKYVSARLKQKKDFFTNDKDVENELKRIVIIHQKALRYFKIISNLEK